MEPNVSKTILPPNNSRAIPLLIIAQIMGVLGDLLLRSVWGLGASIWWLSLFAASAYAVKRSKTRATKSAILLLVVAALFSLLLSWHDSPTLRAVNITCIIVTASLAANYVFEGSLLKSSITSFFLNLTHSFAAIVGGVTVLIGSDISWRELSANPIRKRFGGIARGFIVAVPLLLLFGTLFAQSDAVFLSYVRDTSILFPDDLLSHLLIAGGIAYLVAGLLRLGYIAPLLETGTESLSIRPTFFTETITVLTLVNLLFGLFVYVQFAYLFGGASYIQAQVGLSAAEYARSGFFELLAVTGISLPLLLTAHWLCGESTNNHRRLFGLLAGTYLVLLAVIVASALCRMQLYCNAFGLTELRFYSTVTMIAVSVSLVLFAATVLTGRRRLFAPLCLALLGLTTLAVNALNPDAWIVRSNLAQIRSVGGFDTDYALSLSADALPPLLTHINELPPSTQARIRSYAKANWSQPDDWRAWNLSRAWRSRE